MLLRRTDNRPSRTSALKPRPKTDRPFGLGILPAGKPTRPTAADRAWWAQQPDRDFDALVEELYQEAEATRLLQEGLL